MSELDAKEEADDEVENLRYDNVDEIGKLLLVVDDEPGLELEMLVLERKTKGLELLLLKTEDNVSLELETLLLADKRSEIGTLLIEKTGLEVWVPLLDWEGVILAVETTLLEGDGDVDDVDSVPELLAVLEMMLLDWDDNELAKLLTVPEELETMLDVDGDVLTKVLLVPELKIELLSCSEY